MNWNDLNANIEKGQIEQIYLFYGEEEWTKRQMLDRLRALLLPIGLESINETILTAPSLETVVTAANTFPMMCDRRLVVVYEFSLLMGEGRKSGIQTDADRNEAQIRAFEQWAQENDAPSTTVFYIKGKCDARLSGFKVLQKHACVVEFAHLQGQALETWIYDRLKEAQKTIAKDAVEQIILQVDPDLNALQTELLKLSAFVGQRQQIKKEDVIAIVTSSVEYQVFEIMERLLQDDLRSAQSAIQSLIQAGQSPVTLMAVMISRLRQLMHTRYAMENGHDNTQIANMLSVSSRALYYLRRQAKLVSKGRIQKWYMQAIDLDYKVKSGQVRDLDALEQLVLTISKH